MPADAIIPVVVGYCFRNLNRDACFIWKQKTTPIGAFLVVDQPEILESHGSLLWGLTATLAQTQACMVSIARIVVLVEF